MKEEWFARRWAEVERPKLISKIDEAYRVKNILKNNTRTSNVPNKKAILSTKPQIRQIAGWNRYKNYAVEMARKL